MWMTDRPSEFPARFRTRGFGQKVPRQVLTKPGNLVPGRLHLRASVENTRFGVSQKTLNFVNSRTLDSRQGEECRWRRGGGRILCREDPNRRPCEPVGGSRGGGGSGTSRGASLCESCFWRWVQPWRGVEWGLCWTRIYTSLDPVWVRPHGRACCTFDSGIGHGNGRDASE